MPNPKFPTHEQLLKATETPKSLKQLSAEFGYTRYEGFARQLKQTHPEIFALAKVHGLAISTASRLAEPDDIPDGFAEDAKTMLAVELALKYRIHRSTAVRWRNMLGISPLDADRNRWDRFPKREELLAAMVQPKTLAELSAHFGYSSNSSFNRQMKNGHPDLHAQALEYGKLVRAAKNAETMQKVNRAKRPRKPRIARLNFDRERWVARVTAAMRHLQRQRLGPCYPWQGGYYWMGKRLDDAALIAEAERRGFV